MRRSDSSPNGLLRRKTKSPGAALRSSLKTATNADDERSPKRDSPIRLRRGDRGRFRSRLMQQRELTAKITNEFRVVSLKAGMGIDEVRFF